MLTIALIAIGIILFFVALGAWAVLIEEPRDMERMRRAKREMFRP